ncbi:MAG: response regulator transcription factor [Akkermansiaceae bacterium]|nr:response regulator transcription factor [Akkermansiaceae bacterium]
MEKVLVLEDEVDIGHLVEFNLRRKGYDVAVEHDGREGLGRILKERPDLVTLDLMLPGMNGYEVLKEMQRDPRSYKIPVLMLSAKGQLDDRIKGLELGASDYMTKPFSPKELILKVEALLKLTRSTSSMEEFEFGPFRFDQNNLSFYLNDEPLSLTVIESKLLLFLCQRSGQTQSRNDLLKIVWGFNDDVHSRTLDTHMKRLRQKLGDSSKLIETVRGVGYRISF